MRKSILLGMFVVVLLSTGCESTKQWTKALEDLNKALSPLVIFKKSSQ